ncbi:glycosyltransferase family 2 protein [uncultured Methylobacterium sp.]|jgi:glycosyltransferase involved in cell wall biosynthesis|uniref:glycosyltransferase family 2 protein n=1 Tax=uncultured Methylobacterium sp. TaxID=157278 RepID=UPI00260D6B03|nr:glycosyltransferase family 2 protein [uncultured Methylobacterium sp.]
MLTTSLVVASRNRADRLRQFLARLPVASLLAHGTDIALVDGASSDDTAAVMRDFAAAAPFPVAYVTANQPGLAHAQKLGVELARGDLLIFTDDDCVLDPTYLSELTDRFDPNQFQYGTGEILPADPDADPRIANTQWWTYDDLTLIPAHTVVEPGWIQSANMFFLREVLKAVGGPVQVGSEANSGLLTPQLASQRGYVGAIMPGPKVYHDHGRRRDSAEAEATVDRYARSRGSYFGRLLADRQLNPFVLWHRNLRLSLPWPDLRRLSMELRAAADEIDRQLEERGTATGARRNAG